MSMRTVLAVDLGAESGRVMSVRFDGDHLSHSELHRFANPVTTVNGTMHWDFLHLWREITAGIEKGKALKPASIGIDTWGVDFGLLDKRGNLIANPVNYRDPRTNGMMERVFEIVPRAEVFAQTGIQFMPINALYQFMSLVVNEDPALDIAKTFLTAPDLLHYWLTGTRVCEFTNATTTQMLNPCTGTWANPMLDRLGFPTDIFPEIVQPGTRLGSYHGIPVIAPATHDTGSAVAGMPITGPQQAYISSGTWSLVGLEVSAPVINEAALAANVTNEGGINGTTRLLKNVMGLWIVQQCRATWAAQGMAHDYEDLIEMALAAPALQSLIDVDDPAFLQPGDHPALIRAQCEGTGQPVPQTKGALIRCVLEGLALAYRQVIDTLADLTDQSIELIHIVGGGGQNHLLNQFTANATGCRVQVGPVEATVLGNALIQLIALGECDSVSDGRMLLADPGMAPVEPEYLDEWQAAYDRLCQLKMKRNK